MKLSKKSSLVQKVLISIILSIFCFSLLVVSPSLAEAEAPIPTLSSINITPASPAKLESNSTQQFTAIGTYSNNTTADITISVNWASSNTNAVTFESLGGLAIAGSPGTTSITASLLGVTSPAVTLAVFTSPTVTAASSTNFTDTGVTLNCLVNPNGSDTTVSFAYGNVLEQEGTWGNIISNPQYTATQDVGAGLTPVLCSTTITSLTPGVQYYFSVYANNNAGSNNTNSGEPVPILFAITNHQLTSITITPLANLGVGYNEQLTAIGTYSNNTTADLTNSVNWASQQYQRSYNNRSTICKWKYRANCGSWYNCRYYQH